MSKAEPGIGDVEITLDGVIHILRPTMENALKILATCDRVGGVQAAQQKVASLQFEIICDIIAHGLGCNPTQRQRMIPEMVVKAGLLNLFGPVIRFLEIVSNGGKPVEDEELETLDPLPTS